MNTLETAFLTRERAAEFLGISSKTLERLASVGDGPLFVRIALRRVVYERSDLIAWSKARKFRSKAHELSRSD